MEKDTIKKAIIKFEETIPKNVFEREIKIPKIPFEKAIVIVGPRRAGKTYYLYKVYNSVKNKKPVFLNFEDNMIKDINNKELNLIPEATTELFGSKDFVFFLDEIQAVEGWENFVVTLLNSRYEVYITGSNSKNLSIDIATSLRGKALPFVLLPLSFNEFLNFKNFDVIENIEYSSKILQLKKLFNEYITYGGFPELVIAKEIELKNRLVNNYFDTLVYKDTIERNKIKNSKLVMITAKYLLNLYSNIFSITAYENYLKSNKIPYSLEDIYQILSTLRNIYFISYVKQYSKSYKKSEYSKSKIYLIDTSYIKFIANENEDKGRILENVVFIELFRRQGTIENTKIFYYLTKKGKECDFVVEKNDKFQIIQVCYQLKENNKQRELDAIFEAMHETKTNEGILLTYDQEETIVKEGKKILIKPVWKWIIGK
ncbi:MAG: ATP-binding protein [Candidatus Diapherotrites archaeon]